MSMVADILRVMATSHGPDGSLDMTQYGEKSADDRLPLIRQLITRGFPSKAALPVSQLSRSLRSIRTTSLPAEVLKTIRWNRVYVGDFLGPGGLQYVKAGTSGRVRARLADLIREANRYGFVLMDIWVSLPLRDGMDTERRILRACEGVHGVRHYAERFWGLLFDDCHLWG